MRSHTRVNQLCHLSKLRLRREPPLFIAALLAAVVGCDAAPPSSPVEATQQAFVSETATNVALGKRATASSVETNPYPERRPLYADFAVDGDSTTRWGSVQGVDSNWLEVDLGEGYVLDRTTIRWEAAFASSFQIETSMDRNQWTVFPYTGPGVGGQDTVSTQGAVARYVRLVTLRRGTKYGVSLYEFEIWGRKFVGNIAQGKPATASSSEQNAYPERAPLLPSAAFDGDLRTRWGSVQGNDNQWLQVDLGSVQPVDNVKLHWEAAYASAFNVLVSQDGVNFTAVAGRASGGQAGVETLFFAQTNARYVRLQFVRRATSWGYSLWEVEVSGPVGERVSAELPFWLSYCANVTCGTGPMVVDLCPDTQPDCIGGRETTIISYVDGIQISGLLFPVNGVPEGHTLRHRSGQGQVMGNSIASDAGRVVLRSNVDLTVSFYAVPAVWGGITRLEFVSETFDSPQLKTTVFRHRSYLSRAEVQPLHEHALQIVAGESEIAGFTPGKIRASYVPSELVATVGEGNFSTGNLEVTVNYGNPPYIAQVGLVAQSSARFAHEFVHELFDDRRSFFPGWTPCLNEGLADAFAYTAGFLPVEDFGPNSLSGLSFDDGCAAIAAAPRFSPHDRGNCVFWQVKRLNALTPSFVRNVLSPQRTLSFDSCELTWENTGNSFVVLFSEAAGRDMSQAVTMAGIPHAGSYAAAKQALGLP